MEEITKALAELNKELMNPTKDSTANQGGKFSYKYAALDKVMAHVRPVLAKHDLFIAQDVQVSDDSMVGVRTTIHHASGQMLQFGPLRMRAPQDAQELGKLTTYLRRYGLCAALGIAAEEDDDAASLKKKTQVQRQPRKKEPDTVTESVQGTLEDNQAKAKQIQVFQMVGGYLGSTKPSEVNAQINEIVGVDNYKDLTLEQGIQVLEWVEARG